MNQFNIFLDFYRIIAEMTKKSYLPSVVQSIVTQ